MIIRTLGINDGHTKSGSGCGAVGIINESEHTRLVGSEVRRLLKENGQRVVDCTIDYASSTSENLSLIVSQANRQDLDWFVSIHFNAGGGKGVEVYTYEGRQFEDAISVGSNISETLQIPNRGVKSGTGLYVIRKTKAKSMLIEVCFVDTDDANKYLSVGYTKIAEAIVKGLLGAINTPSVTPPSVTPPTQPSVPPVTENYVNVASKYLGSAHMVKTVQYTLNCFGYNLSVDGKCGIVTANAIGNFQEKYGLTKDYKFGIMCFTKSYEILKSRLLKRGSTGEEVKLLQHILVISCDGIFGTQTEESVKKYQKSKSLSADGKVGINTWKKLLEI